MADPQTRRFARQLVGIEERLRHLETVPQLAHSSIDDHGVPVYDKDGNLTSIVGKQQDGTWGAPPLAGPVPDPPSGISARGGAGIVHVHWNGTFSGGAAPLDFDAIEVLVDGVLAGAMPDRDGGSITISAEQGTRYISARVRTLVPRHSRTTSPFSVDVRAPAEVLFDDTTERAEALQAELDASLERLQAAEQNLATLRDTTLPGMRAELDAADTAAAEALAEYEARLVGAEESLTTARDELAALRSTLDGTDLTSLQEDLAAALAELETFQSETMPALDQRLAEAEAALQAMAETDVGDLITRLGAAEESLAVVRSETIPGLQQVLEERIADTETALRADLATATADLGVARTDLDAALGQLDQQDAVLAEQQARVDEIARQASRGPVPPRGAPMGAHWVTPEGRLYVRVPCDEEGVA